MAEREFKIDDTVQIIGYRTDLKCGVNCNENLWSIVLFPEDGDDAAIIENLYTEEQTIIELSKLKYAGINVECAK